VQLNSKANLSEHFVLGEFTRSKYPEVYNIPSHEAIANLKRLCEWLEVLRERVRHSIIINSGYRSPQLNRKVGGAPTSNHLTGCAADIRTNGMEQAIVYAAILINYAKESQQEFDELLIEKNRYGAIWLHFAVRPKENRRKVAFILSGGAWICGSPCR
ncbi:MAG: D-Ala-D-Ala carboxypeptidase family metallohydrolase, partial [Prevotella sp.]|nr:D-Ala-D-Ala carboxypeptidase family metallohydrolase [Prevotella sp.]